MAGRSGLKIMGYLVKMDLGSECGDFMFKTPFGIAALVFPLIHDNIRVGDELRLDQPAVFLSSFRFPDDRIRLEAQPRYGPSAEQIESVKQQFKSWIEDGTGVIVTTGDNMRMTMCFCEMTIAGEGSYMLTDRQARSIHVVFPKESGLIQVEQRDDRAEVTLHNRDTNSFISIRQAPKGKMESPEELLARYPLANRLVH
jgi:hypothetical protein